jgi:hypothetical protein
MRKYLKEAIEWMARKFVEAAASRAIQIVQEFDEEYRELPRLAATKLPEIEYHH